MKKISFLMVLAATFIVYSYPTMAFAQAKTTPLSIAATGQASSYYTYNVAIAQLVNKNVPNVNATVLETGGFADNIKLIERGRPILGRWASLICISRSIQ